MFFYSIKCQFFGFFCNTIYNTKTYWNQMSSFPVNKTKIEFAINSLSGSEVANLFEGVCPNWQYSSKNYLESPKQILSSRFCILDTVERITVVYVPWKVLFHHVFDIKGNFWDTANMTQFHCFLNVTMNAVAHEHLHSFKGTIFIG